MKDIAIPLVCLVAVAVLAAVAWTGWARQRPQLPPWRNGLSLTALLLLSLNWAAICVLEVPILVSENMHRSVAFTWGLLVLSHPADLLIVVLAFALKRVPRLAAILAGIALLFCWPIGYS